MSDELYKMDGTGRGNTGPNQLQFGHSGYAYEVIRKYRVGFFAVVYFSAKNEARYDWDDEQK